jgi:hypothetical protein
MRARSSPPTTMRATAMRREDPHAWFHDYVARFPDADGRLPLTIDEFEGEPRPGTYAMRWFPRSRHFLPVSVTVDGEVYVGGMLCSDRRYIWQRCVKFPISPEEYQDMIEPIEAMNAEQYNWEDGEENADHRQG